MDESTSQDLEKLLGELEDEYGAEEALAPEVEKLLEDLHPENLFAVRQRAVEQLGRLETSHPRILRALITFKEFDDSQMIRILAAEALQAPAHQELLHRQPGLAERIVADMAPGPVPEEPRAREYAPPPPAATPSRAAGPLTWSQVWVQALTQPSVETFKRLLRDPNATSRTAYAWMAITGLIAYLLSWLLIAVLGGGGLADGLGELAAFGLCGAIVAPILTVLALIIGTGITHALARMLGGTGSYSELAYAYATFQAPMMLISGVISMIPIVSYLSFALSLYMIVLSVLAVKAVHDLGTGAAIASALVLPIVAVIVIATCLGLGIAAFVSSAF